MNFSATQIIILIILTFLLFGDVKNIKKKINDKIKKKGT